MLRLPREVVNGITQHVLSVYPEEGCGLLVGVIDSGVKIVRRAVPTKNVYSGSRRNRYAVDPLEYMRIEEQESKNGLEVLGVFHSHPDAPASPSPYDQQNAVPNLSYVIISVRLGRVEEVKAWKLDEGSNRFVQEAMEIL